MKINNKICLIIFMFGLLSIEQSNAQVSPQWLVRYNGPGNGADIGRAMVVDKSGNIYVTGTCSNVGLDFDVCTIKYNTMGVQEWISIYSGPEGLEDNANSIAVDAIGNVYVTGSLGGHTNQQDYLTIKYNSSGVQQWAVRYNGPGNNSDEAYSIAVDDSGYVYVTGRSISNGRYDYCTIKYDSAGIQKWVERFNGTANLNDQAFHLRLDDSSNVYVTGGINGISFSESYCTIKYNTFGIQQWTAIYGGDFIGYGEAKALAVDKFGNVYVTGEYKGIESDYDVCTIKYNSAGFQIWASQYNGPANYLDRGNAVSVNQSGDVYVAGWSYGIGTLSDIITIKYDSSGAEQWVSRYNGPANDIDYISPRNSLATDSLDNVYVAGWSKGINSQHDLCVIKYNSSGIQQWSVRYNGPGNGNDYGVAIALDNKNDVYVFGQSFGLNTHDDFTLVKYSHLVSYQINENEYLQNFELYQNYPNPFNPITKVKFQMSNEAFVKLIVFDVLGREVEILVNGKLSQGIYEIDFDGSNYSGGIYYLNLFTEDYTNTKKMILNK